MSNVIGFTGAEGMRIDCDARGCHETKMVPWSSVLHVDVRTEDETALVNVRTAAKADCERSDCARTCLTEVTHPTVVSWLIGHVDAGLISYDDPILAGLHGADVPDDAEPPIPVQETAVVIDIASRRHK